jgi:hypothetical protein
MFKNEDPTIEIWKEKYKHDLVIDVEKKYAVKSCDWLNRIQQFFPVCIC